MLAFRITIQQIDINQLILYFARLLAYLLIYLKDTYALHKRKQVRKSVSLCSAYGERIN